MDRDLLLSICPPLRTALTRETWEAINEAWMALKRLLADPRTTFVVVSTLEAAPSHEAAYLARELSRRELHLGARRARRGRARAGAAGRGGRR